MYIIPHMDRTLNNGVKENREAEKLRLKQEKVFRECQVWAVQIVGRFVRSNNNAYNSRNYDDFLAAARKKLWDTIRGGYPNPNEPHFKNYACRSMTNAILDTIREHKIHEISSVNAGSFDDTEHQIADQHMTYSPRVSLNEDEIIDGIVLEEVVKRVITGSNPDHKEALYKYYLEGCKQEDIAKELGISSPMLKSIIFRSRKEILRILKNEGYERYESRKRSA